MTFMNMVQLGSEPVPVISVQASNKGRGTCEVTQWWLQDNLDKKKGTVIIGHVIGSAKLPVTLEGLHSVAWMVRKDTVMRDLVNRGVSRVRPIVSIGSGKRFHGKWVKVTKPD